MSSLSDGLLKELVGKLVDVSYLDHFVASDSNDFREFVVLRTIGILVRFDDYYLYVANDWESWVQKVTGKKTSKECALHGIIRSAIIELKELNINEKILIRRKIKNLNNSQKITRLGCCNV